MLTLHVARLPSSCSEPSSRSPATVAGMKSSIRLLHAPWARPPASSRDMPTPNAAASRELQRVVMPRSWTRRCLPTCPTVATADAPSQLRYSMHTRPTPPAAACSRNVCLLRTFARRLRTVVNRPQTGPKLGPSAVGQRPALIHDWRSSGPHRVHLAISHGPEHSSWTMEGE